MTPRRSEAPGRNPSTNSVSGSPFDGLDREAFFLDQDVPAAGVAVLDHPAGAGAGAASVEPDHTHEQEHQGEVNEPGSDGVVAGRGIVAQIGYVDGQAREPGEPHERSPPDTRRSGPSHKRREFHSVPPLKGA